MPNRVEGGAGAVHLGDGDGQEGKAEIGNQRIEPAARQRVAAPLQNDRRLEDVRDRDSGARGVEDGGGEARGLLLPRRMASRAEVSTITSEARPRCRGPCRSRSSSPERHSPGPPLRARGSARAARRVSPSVSPAQAARAAPPSLPASGSPLQRSELRSEAIGLLGLDVELPCHRVGRIPPFNGRSHAAGHAARSPASQASQQAFASARTRAM